MTRLYSVFDPGNIGPDLLIDGGGNILTTDGSGLSIARSCRGTLGQDRFEHHVQFLIYTPNAPGAEPTIDDKISIGLVTAAASMSAYVGSAANSIGYRPAEGEIHLNGSSIASVDTAGLDDLVRMLVEVHVDSVGVTWFKNDVALHTEVLESGWFGETLHWAVSLGSDAAAGDILIHVNTGEDAFQFASPNADGWWSRPPAAPLLRLATRDFLSLPTDDLPNARFAGVIMPGSQDARGVAFEHRAGGEPGGRGAALELALLNRNGMLDPLITGAYAGLPVYLQELPDGETSLDAAEDLGAWIFDRSEVTGDITVRAFARDNLSLLDDGTQDARFLPNATDGAANREMPFVIGTAWQMNPPVEVPDDDGSPKMPRYRLDNFGVSMIGRVRQRAQPLDPTASYELLPGGQQLRLDTSTGDFPGNVVNGVITLDVSNVGVAYNPAPGPDAIGDAANPITGVDMGAFDDFNVYVGDTGTGGTHTCRFRTGGIMEWNQNGGEPQSYTEFTGAFNFEAGKKYRVEFELLQICARSPQGLQCRVGLSKGGSWPTFFLLADSETPVGIVSGVYSCITTHPLRPTYDGNNTVNGPACRIRNIRVWEIPPVDDDAADEAVENELARIGVEAFMRDVIERRGKPLPSSFWEAETAAAIDTMLGTPAVGIGSTQQMKKAETIQSIMGGIVSSTYRGPTGKLRVARLITPEDYVQSEFDSSCEFVIDWSLMRSPLKIVMDRAQGLTKQIGARYNEYLLTDADADATGVDVTMRVRARLKRRSRYIRTSAAQLAPMYRFADSAPPTATRLADPEDAQVTADFLGRHHRIARAFYVVDIPRLVGPDICSVGWLKYPHHGLSTGVPVVIEHIVRDLTAPFWPMVVLSGPAPGTAWNE